MSRLLTGEEITRLLGDLPGWRTDGVTQLDIEPAHRISQAAARLGAVAQAST